MRNGVSSGAIGIKEGLGRGVDGNGVKKGSIVGKGVEVIVNAACSRAGMRLP